MVDFDVMFDVIMVVLLFLLNIDLNDRRHIISYNVHAIADVDKMLHAGVNAVLDVIFQMT